MIFRKRWLLLYLFYILFTSIFFLSSNFSSVKNANVTFFFQDTNIKYKIISSLALDPNTGPVFIPRMFHNKVVLSMDTFSTSIFDASDPVFLFSLSKDSPLYAPANDIKMLYPIEIILFILAGIQLIRSYDPKKKFYIFILVFFLFSFLITGILLPTLYPVKMLPLVIAIRTVIFFGILDWLKDKKWAKKYFS